MVTLIGVECAPVKVAAQLLDLEAAAVKEPHEVFGKQVMMDEVLLDLLNALAALAVEQHRRRVSTSVVNEVLKEALSWRSPPTTRGGRQGRLYYGTQVASRPPSFTLFVNDPKLFGDTYRRYVERQIREGLGFDGTPVKLFWRGKQQRDAERDLARQHQRSS